MNARVWIVVAILQLLPAALLQGCHVKVRMTNDGGLDAASATEPREQAHAESMPPEREPADAGPSKPAGGSGGAAGRARGAAGESAGKGGAADSSSGGRGGAANVVEVCRVEKPVRAAANTTIWMVVDGSGSMLDMLGDKTRWAALREALLDNASGVIRSVSQARWGLALFDGPLGGAQNILPDGGVFMPPLPPATTCPRVVSVDPKSDNFAAINAAYPLDPLGGSTPTDGALKAVTGKILAGASHVPDNMPTIIVLATDGNPNDLCSVDTSLSTVPRDTRPDVIMAVQKLAQAGVKTYVISLAGDDQALTDHLTQVAQAGSSGRPLFIPANKTQLIDALRQIVSTEPNCDVMLNHEIDPLRACDGTVQLAGKELTCNGADGFGMRDSMTLRLAGAACTTYKSNPETLKVSYPCDALR